MGWGKVTDCKWDHFTTKLILKQKRSTRQLLIQDDCLLYFFFKESKIGLIEKLSKLFWLEMKEKHTGKRFHEPAP